MAHTHWLHNTHRIPEVWCTHRTSPITTLLRGPPEHTLIHTYSFLRVKTGRSPAPANFRVQLLTISGAGSLFTAHQSSAEHARPGLIVRKAQGPKARRLRALCAFRPMNTPYSLYMAQRTRTPTARKARSWASLFFVPWLYTCAKIHLLCRCGGGLHPPPPSPLSWLAG